MIRRTFVLAFPLVLSACSSNDASGTGAPPAPTAKVYVADEDSSTLSILDGHTNALLKTIDLNDGGHMVMPHNVQVAPDGQSVWVAAPPMEGAMPPDDAEEVIVLDAASDTIVQRVTLGTELHLAHVVLDDRSEIAYVTANGADKVFAIDAEVVNVFETPNRRD